MKSLTLPIRSRHIRRLVMALCCLLCASSASMAQQEAQAGDAPIVLTKQTRTRVINPGRRIKLYGPPGTLAIKGKLVSMGDSISIRPDNIRLAKQVRKVAVSDVRAVGMRRLGWKILALYMASQATLVLLFTLIAFLTSPVLVPGAYLLVLVYQGLYYGAVIGLCLAFANPRYNLPPWSLFRRGSR